MPGREFESDGVRAARLKPYVNAARLVAGAQFDGRGAARIRSSGIVRN